LARGLAYEATLWTVGLNSGSSGQDKTATVSTRTITALPMRCSHLLYPHSAGGVVAKITNPNHFTVTITKIKLPISTAHGIGYSTSSLATTTTGCGALATESDVTSHYSSGTTRSSHTLATPLTVAAMGQSGDRLTVTLTDDASMGTASATCEATFKTPSLSGAAAYVAGSLTLASRPTTNKWTSRDPRTPDVEGCP
jgi:hypothetical protein